MASTYLTKTLTTPTSDKIFTFSAWVKRSALGSEGYVFTIGSNGGSSPSHYYSIRYANEKIYVQRSGTGQLITNAVYRDTSAWYHIVLTNDTTQATDSNRIKLYVNGELASLGTATYPSQNTILDGINGARCALGLTYSGTGNYFDGLMTHIHFIDGTAYDADTFGETDATTGIWKPKTAPSVTYGTNGFFLKGENSGALGTDSSGNANNFTVNGTPTQTIDTPSNVFATLNALDNYYFGGTFSNGNTTVLSGSSQYSYCTSNFGVGKGKYYIEAKYVANSGGDYSRFGIGYKPATSTTDGLGDETGEAIYRPDGVIKVNNSETSSWGATWTTGDIISIALDCDNSKLYFSKNGVFQGSGNPTAGTGGIAITDVTTLSTGNYFFGFGDNAGSGTATWSYNFGNGFFGTTAVASAQNPDDGIGIFEYDVPTGYRALCTKSINAQEYS